MTRLLGCALCLFAACASVRSSASSPRADVVAVKDLPPAAREVLLAYSRGGDEWEAKRSEVLADPALVRFLVDNLVVEMMRGYDGFAGAADVRARDAYLRAQSELARYPEVAAPVLAGLLAVGDGIAADLAARTLVLIGKPAVESTDRLLSDERPSARRRAAAVLVELPHGGRELEDRVRRDLIHAAYGDSEWIVRAQCAEALGARGARDSVVGDWRAALERVLVDPDPSVRASAASALTTLGDPNAIPSLANALARASSRGEPKVLAAVERALHALAKDSRDRSPQEWLDWFKEHRAATEGARQSPRKP